MPSFTPTKEDVVRASNAVDVSSLSNPSEARATHLDLKVSLDFDKKTIAGTAAYAVDVQVKGAKHVAFDCKDLIVNYCTVNGTVAKFDLLTIPSMDPAVFGKSLQVNLPPNLPANTSVGVCIDYSTTPRSSAIQWLPPSQTLGKVRPYMFTQVRRRRRHSPHPNQRPSSVHQSNLTTIT